MKNVPRLTHLAGGMAIPPVFYAIYHTEEVTEGLGELSKS